VRGDSGLSFPRLDYQANVTDEEARVLADITAECTAKKEVGYTLFEGELALLPPKLPTPLRIEREGNTYKLVVSKPGRYEFKLELLARVKHVEPWNQISFTGPAAAIASVVAEAAGANVDLQLLSGTLLSSAQSNGMSRVKAFLGPDQTVALRWSRAGGVGEVARKAVITGETSIDAQITPTVIKYATQVHYDILQGKTSKLLLALPASHALTRLVGEQIRDWELKPASNSGTSQADGMQLLEVQLIKPLENQYQLTLYSEQTVESTPAPVSLAPPQPMELERESGSLTLTTEDTLAEVDSAAGLRQVNAPNGALAAYRFNGRPFALSLRLRRIEPVISVAERVSARVEETRLVSSHSLTLDVQKAGVYALDLLPPSGFAVTEVRGEGVEDWKVIDSQPNGERKLRVNFSNRVLGARKLEVQLEQPLKTFPEQIALGPLRVAGASRETSELGAASAPGIRLKSAELVGVREVPIRTLQPRANGAASDELLGYTAEQPDWKISLATERLAPRILADVFNLVTIGDGIVGGSATIRYALLNQGVQQFDISIPVGWKNVEFTGPNIRRKEQKADGTWTIGLQDKVWDGYTLVVTYDFQFDAKGATLPLGGIHTLGVERETGSVAVTTAASLKLSPKTVSNSLRPLDELELSAPNRALITRSVLLAYQYDDPKYNLELDVKRFDEVSVLSAVADRTQLTTVLTDAGEMLTQASFMVKNNDKQFQRFKLPKDAKFWSCHVNGQPVKAERDGDWLMAPLPRGANRDQAFAVDIVYAETNGAKPAFLPRTFALQAPQTDVPNTYAEWQLYAPATYRLSGFAGNMFPVRGTTYDIRDASQKFIRFYWDFLHESGLGLLFVAALIGLVIALVASASRRGAGGVLSVLVVFAIVAILAAMLLPALARAKARSQRINSVNNLKQIGLAFKTFALDNTNRLPLSFEEAMNELSTDKITYDPLTGQRYIYLAAGLNLDLIQPESVIAYSPPNNEGHREVLLADGSVQQLSVSRFDEMARRGWILPVSGMQAALNQQLAAVRGAQFQPATAQPLPAVPGSTETATGLPAAGPRIRSIRIDIPREGQAFAFTKVLHLDNKPLNVQVKVMKLQTFLTLQMCAQSAAFLAGLAVWFWQWRTARNSFILTLALTMSLCAVGSLLLAWRILHLAFIWLAPIFLLAIVAWLFWKFWPRSRATASAPETGLEPGIPPAVATIAFLAFSLLSSSAAPATKVESPDSVPDNVSILSAVYNGTVAEHVAQVDATIVLKTDAPNEKVRLFGEDVAVRQFCAKPESKLVREGNNISVLMPRRGETTLRLTLLIKLGGDVTKRQLAFAIPGALTSQLALTLDQPDADVEFPAAISVKRTTSGQQTRLEAVMGSGDRVELFWTPRVKRAAEIAANIICHNATLLTFGNGVLNARAAFDYQVTQGEMRQARVRLPVGHRLLRVEGEGIRTWELKSENGASIVQVELLKGVAPNYQLTVETEKALDSLPALVKAEIPHADNVKRETGLIAVRGDEELELAVENTGELYRVDTEEFNRVTGQKINGAINAFRFLKPEFTLQMRVAAMQPQIEAVVHNYVRVSPEQLNLTGVVDYTIKRAGVFALKLALPGGYRLDNVTGANILQTAERTESGQPMVEVTLKERTSGPYALRLELSQILKELPKELNIVGVHPLRTEKLTGFVLVSVEPGVALKPATFDGLTEVPAASLSTADNSVSPTGALAYKFIATAPQPAQAWHLAVETETVASWVRAEIVNTLTLSDALISGRAVARFDIQNAPMKELHLRIPADFKHVEISAPNIRRRDHDGEVWTVEFQSKIRGPHTLTVTWEQPRVSRTNYVELRGIAAENVERDTGVLTVIARPPLQVTAQNTGDLKPIDLRDLPEWAGQPDESTVLAYRYLRPGFTLAVDARRFAEAEVLQALVENLNLSTVVADDGQMMTEMSLSVRNQGRQHLEIALPAGATVWSAFVAGQAVRPSIKDGKLLLPLEHSLGDDSAIPIDLVYVDTSVFPQKRGAVELISPRLDAPLKSARWELFLPPDYDYSRFSGTMSHENETAMVEASSFSFLDWSSRESKNKAELAKEWKSELSNAQKNLGVGNVKEALADYNRARNKTDLNGANNGEARQLEADLRRAQGNALIEAQNAFSLSNNGQISQAPQQVQAAPAVRYDNETAEAQWTKLQQAQDLGIAAAQPIRVNLPTRGLRHAFTQVLQTEVGRPLTVRLFAANTRALSWPKRIAAPLAGFVLLWFLVSLMARRGGTRNPFPSAAQ
jgi:type II secretory pathway pseudopilin PulG